MPDLAITANLEIDPWTDLLGQLPHNTDGACAAIERVGLLPDGTQEGRACVEFLIRLPDGTHVIAETTWRLFQAMAIALSHTPVAHLENL